MNPEQFWNSTMYELCVYVEAVRNKEECKFKDMHYLAALVRVAVVSAFNSEVTIPAYEDIMSGAGRTSAEKTNIYYGWEDSKAYMIAIQDQRRRDNDN